MTTPEKIADARPLLPTDADFVEIAGLNHAGFGDYGVQPGDNTATITTQEQRDEITDALATVLTR